MLAEKLVAGETEALSHWPTVDDVALAQLNAMKEVIEGQ